MSSSSVSTLLSFARQQMAAEAFLSRAEDPTFIPPENRVGTRLQEGNTHSSFFVQWDAQDFEREFSVLAQFRNDPLSPVGSGFSGTLFLNKRTGERTLSFRSTEFIDDNIRDSKSTNDLEVRQLGWAFGQISEMEAWYAKLRADTNLLGGRDFYVTGYSLGGHLATAFNILRREEEARGKENPILQTYTFNGAGVGGVKDGVTLTEVMATFERLRSVEFFTSPEWLSLSDGEKSAFEQEAQRRVNAIVAERDRVRGLAGVTFAFGASEAPLGEQATVSYQLAALLTAFQTVKASNFPFFGGVNDFPSRPVFAQDLGLLPIQNMTEVVGSDSGKLGPSFVANSGIHYGERAEVYIEDQPLTRGSYVFGTFPGDLAANPMSNDFADTHSLVLVVDSLALLSVFETLDPNFSQANGAEILSAASSAKAITVPSTQGRAEGDTLERTLDSLRRIVVGPDSAPVVEYESTLSGNTWYERGFRTSFYEKLAELREVLPEFIGDQGTPRVVLLTGKTKEELASLAKSEGSSGLAYRVALRELSPFAIVGVDYALRNEAAELDYGRADGKGMSDQYIDARAAFLSQLLELNQVNGDIPLSVTQPQYIDGRLRTIVGNAAAPKVIFDEGSGSSAPRRAGVLDDKLFGSVEGDSLAGNGGADYLEGRGGADLLDGGPGNDVLNGVDGAASDRLLGGAGYDTFHADWGDTVSDTPGETRGGIVYIGPDKLQLTDGFRTGDTGFFQSSNGIRYWEAPDGRIVAYDSDGGKLAIEAPGGEVKGLDSTGSLRTSGRPDLGIRLVSLLDERPQLRLGKDAIPSLWKLGRTWVAKGDPLALDLDEDGVETLGGESGRAVLFDHSADGVRDGSGWLTSDDAWVALDLDGNGMIDSGRELFGTDTLLPGGAKARDGFEALAALDSNTDGRIDIQDASYADLLVWRDENLNGISEGFELQGFAEAGIASVSLFSTPSGAPLPGGNQVVSTGTYTLTNGTTRQAAALDLVRETYYREFAEAPALAADVDDLPALPGSGRVRSLPEAAAESPEVRAALAGVMDAETRDEQLTLVGGLLDAWAGSSKMDSGRVEFAEGTNTPILNFRFQGLASLEPGAAYLSLAREGTPLSELPENWFLSAQGDEYQARVRKLEILERFTGQTLAKVGSMHGQQVYASDSGTVRLYADAYAVGAQNFVFLDQAYAALEEQTYLGIALETRLKPYVDAFVEGQEDRDFAALEGLLARKRAEDFGTALGDFVDLARAIGYELVDRGWVGLMPMLESWIRDARSNPTLSEMLDGLPLKFRGDFRLEGAGTSDILLGDPSVTFSAGTWTTDGSFGDDLIFGGDARPTQISDGEGADLVLGGPEADTYLGGAGRDLYLFGRGSGRDVLTSEYMHQAGVALDRDVLQLLPGITPDDILVRRAYQPFTGSLQLDIVIADTGDTFSDKFFFHSDTARLLDEIRFADGTRWDISAIRQRVTLGSPGDDNADSGLPRVFGTSADELLQGLGGDDVLLAAEGNDTLLGGTGVDLLEGYFGDDILDGGLGNDRLYGGHGVDTYVLQRGGGRDEVFRGSFISNAFSDTQETDVIRVAEGIAPIELRVQWTPIGTRFVLADESSEIWDWGSPFNAAYAGAGGGGPSIARVEFADGTVWDNATIREYALHSQTEQADELWGYDDTGDVLLGSGGDDVIRAQGGDDTLDGGPGNDLLHGGAGADTFVLAPGGGNDHIFLDGDDRILVAPGVSTDDLVLTRAGQEFTVALGAGQASMTGSDTLARITFADGTTWGQAEIRARISLDGGAGADEIFGFDESDDLIRGLSGNDVLRGLRGKDTLVGGPGDDDLQGGEGEDTYVFGRGDGMDFIDDAIAHQGENNILVLRDVIRGEFYRPNRQTLRIGGTSDGIRLFTLDPSITKVVYADGEVDGIDDLPTTYTAPDSGGGGGSGAGEGTGGTGGDSGGGSSGSPFVLPDIPPMYGAGETTNGDDWIFGTDAPDVLAGGPGFDVLVGHRGRDTYLFNRGDGADLIVDNDEDAVTSVIRFGPGIAESDLQVVEDGQFRFFLLPGGEDAVAYVGPLPQLAFADAEAGGGGDDSPPAGGGDQPGESPEGGAQDSTARAAALPDIASQGPIDGTSGLPLVQDNAPSASERSPSELALANPYPNALAANVLVGTSSDPLYRDIDQRLDVLLQVGRVNLTERYGDAIREFEERRRAREAPTEVPAPTETEVQAWNEAMHAWHDRHAGFAESEFGSRDGTASIGWGIPAASESVWGYTMSNPFSPPALANPHALPGVIPAGASPGLAEGLRIRF